MNNLDEQIRALRHRYAAARSSSESREDLLRRFDARQPAAARHNWAWSLPVAAALIFGLILMHPAPRRTLSITSAGAQDASYLASTDPQEDGFIAVPYVPPLATGELVRVVHTQLYPSALASLGVNVDPSWNTQVQADLLMGEDGFPRAVRVSNEF